MSAYVAHGTNIPASEFSCPANWTGPDYAFIPWSNMSLHLAAHNGTDPGGYCGIKGPHPRMSHCCQCGQTGYSGCLPNAIHLAEADHCSQFCQFFAADLDLWLYCLTQDGHTATNAFCRAPNGSYLDTSGTLPRDGPFDPNSYLIKLKKSSAAIVGKATPTLWQISVVAVVVMMLSTAL